SMRGATSRHQAPPVLGGGGKKKSGPAGGCGLKPKQQDKRRRKSRPAIPVMPIRKPTPKPETEYSGSMESKMLIRLARALAAVFRGIAAAANGARGRGP